MLALLVYLTAVLAHPVGIGDRAPPMPRTDIDGKPVALSRGEAVAVVFFATWCEPCHAAITDLLAAHEMRGVFNIVLVAVGEDAATVRGFLEKRRIGAVTVALDPTAQVARAWGQDRFPTSFFVDENQTIRHINRGYGRGFRARIERWLAGMSNAMDDRQHSPNVNGR